MGVCNCFNFCCTLLCVSSSIAIILMGKRELVALLNLSSWCLVMVEQLFLAVPQGCLRFVIVVFPDHTHLLYFMSHHSVISLELNLNKIEQAKGYLKVNNNLVLQSEYQDKIRNAIKETVDINKNGNPNTLWEIIKSSIRNETIKYASFKKKEQNKKENPLKEEINKIKNNLMKGNDNEEDDLKRLKEKDQELQN